MLSRQSQRLPSTAGSAPTLRDVNVTTLPSACWLFAIFYLRQRRGYVGATGLQREDTRRLNRRQAIFYRTGAVRMGVGWVAGDCGGLRRNACRVGSEPHCPGSVPVAATSPP